MGNAVGGARGSGRGTDTHNTLSGVCSVGLGTAPLPSGLDPFNKGFEGVLLPGSLFHFAWTNTQ